MKNKLQNRINEDALLREVVEDVKNEQMQRLWDKYGLLVIIGIALVLTAAISFESLRSWQQRKNQELSDAYSIALSLQNQGRFDESLDVYKALADKASGIYAGLARIQIANVYLEQDKKEDAFAVLESIVADSSVLPQLQNIAALKLASYKLDANAPAAEVLALLDAELKNDNGSDVARELAAMLYLREKDFVKARAEYTKITNSPTASDSLKARARDMLNLLDENH